MAETIQVKPVNRTTLRFQHQLELPVCEPDGIHGLMILQVLNRFQAEHSEAS